MNQISSFEPVATVQGYASRGNYRVIQHIVRADGSKLYAHEVLKRFAEVLPQEHGSYDKKGRGSSLSVDLYAFDEAQNVAIVQLRMHEKFYANGFSNTRKDYALVGQNENGTFFRHPVSAHAVHAGIAKAPTDPASAVEAAQRSMWNVTSAQLARGIRQGDILIVPGRRPANATVIEESVVLVGETHEINAEAFLRDPKGIVWAKAPTVRHTKGQHTTAFGDNDGWHSIRVAETVPTWAWGTRISD